MSAQPHPIAYLISQYPAVSHTFIQREIEALSDSGFRIHVASINDPDSTSKGAAEDVFYVKKEGMLAAFLALVRSLMIYPIFFIRSLINVFSLAGFDLKKILYHFFYLGEAALVAEWMDKNGAKHLHVHFANAASTVALLICKLRPYTYSITIHGPDEFYDVSNSNLVKKFTNARFLCCIGYFARSQVMRLLPQAQWSKVEITPMGVDTNEYKPSTEHLNKSPLTIACVGRLHANKGQFILLDAISKLAQEGLNCKLNLIGDGPDKKALQRRTQELQLQKLVSFEGPQKPADVKKYLAETDLFVLASFAEGIPVSLMEAMSMEIPCISTFVNGIPELIEPGYNGLLVAPSDSFGLAKMIRELSKDAKLRAELGRNARKTIQEKWDLSTNVKKLAQVFRKYE